ncbi:amidase [Bordetella pertussis]|nr:amidase [Bordetella pertussis]
MALCGQQEAARALDLPGPLGVQVVAARFREDLCLAAGADIEARGAPVTLAGP